MLVKLTLWDIVPDQMNTTSVTTNKTKISTKNIKNNFA